MLTEKENEEIRKELDNCTRPLIFFHDDADGVCSFLLLYRYKKEGKGVIVKSTPKVDMKFLRKVEEYQPDKIFVVDVPMMDEEFVKNVKVPIIWIDHHTPQNIDKVKYFNPRLSGTHEPATELCYGVVKRDLWIAQIGCVGDWFLPDFTDEFIKKYPKLLSKKIKTPEKALFQSKLGELVRIISFILKGKISDVMKSIKILTRIQDPYEILDNKTPQSNFIMKRYKKYNTEYQELLKEAKKRAKKDKFLIFIYKNTQNKYKLFPNIILLLRKEKKTQFFQFLMFFCMF